MIRLVVCAMVLVGCKRDPNEWPATEVSGFEATTCPQSFADARLCKCLAPALAKRLPYPQADAFFKAGMKGGQFADVIDVLKEELATCGRDRGKEPWPQTLRDGFIKGCMSNQTPRENCECHADYAEKTITFVQFLSSSLDRRAGRPVPPEVTALFTAEEAVACLQGGKWTPALMDRVTGDCQTELEGTVEQCRCYANKMRAEVSMHDFFVLAGGLDGGAKISARIEERAPAWWLACSEPAKKKKRR